MHVISQIIDGGAIEADGGASVPVGPSVATPLHVCNACNNFVYIMILFISEI